MTCSVVINKYIYDIIFGPIGLKILMGTQEAIIYRLVMRNLSYDAYISFLIFLATFGEKVGVATTRPLIVWGLQTKKLAHWVDLLSQPLSRNHVFEIVRPEPPLNNKFFRLIILQKLFHYYVFFILSLRLYNKLKRKHRYFKFKLDLNNINSLSRNLNVLTSIS